MAIVFVTGDDVAFLRNIEEFCDIKIEEMPANVADLIYKFINS